MSAPPAKARRKPATTPDRPIRKVPVRFVILAAIALSIAAGAALMATRRTDGVGATGGGDPYADVPVRPDSAVPALEDADVEALGRLTTALFRGEPPPDPPAGARLSAPALVVHTRIRKQGRLVDEALELEGTALQAVQRGVEALAKEHGSDRAIDTLEVELGRNFRDHDFATQRKALLAKAHVGMRGLAVTLGDGRDLYASPALAIAKNEDYADALRAHAERVHLSVDDVLSMGRFASYETEHVLVELATGHAQRLVRGNHHVPMSSVERPNVEVLRDLAGGWLERAVHDDGRLTYQLYPSLGTEETERNNMVRQWMATLALTRLAKARDDDALAKLAAKNIEYNLRTFYREEEGFGLIEFEGKVKLGAVALAALALVEHPDRARWERQEKALERTVEHLQQDDGSFRTFYAPAERNDNQNFYPGEALVLWATLYAQESEPRDPARLDRFMKAFAYYRSYHLEKAERRPSFVPWHTQADYLVWTVTKDKALSDFIFETNDWLLAMQQWDGPKAIYEDVRGRYYDPDRPNLGVAHASSTGVYLEGLIDAYRLARELGDEGRRERYRVAIARGLRSVMQLQFADDVDMYYVPVEERDVVRGGIRTTVNDNRVRCDNVQHNLLALLKILDTFEDGDYRAE